MAHVDLASDIGAIVPLIVLWATSALILLGEVFIWKRSGNLSPLVALAGILVAILTTFSQSWTPAFNGSIVLDGLAMVSSVALLVAGLLSVLLAWTYLKNRNLEHGEYYALVLLSLSGGMMMTMANDLIVLFLGLEILSFGLYILAGFARTEAKSEEASIKYFLLGAFASAFFLYGIALMYGGAQTTNLDAIREAVRMATSKGHLVVPMMLAGIGLIIVGLSFKAAIIPFHQWTPDVYEGAPTSVTAYMAGAAKIGAFAAFLRVLDILVPLNQYWLPILQVLAILTMMGGNLFALMQSNIKRMLAYSSIAHAGYLLVAVCAMSVSSLHGVVNQANVDAVHGAMFYLFAYVFMTLGAFAVLIYLSHRGKDFQTIRDLRGLMRQDSFAAYCMLFFMLSLAGIPSTMGFWGKWQIFFAALQAGQTTLAVVMALASAMGAYYYLKVVWVMAFEEPGESALTPPVAKAGAGVAMGLSALATVGFFLLPDLLNGLTHMAK